ncbi:MAG: AAA family ATPase [Sedimentisphaerales bacterium]|nr:AAA family ATPase [Sedimentisphaerales bacterium]
MIEQISIKNFKSFKDVTVKLGPLNIFIGPNASGKSNFFDALRVLQGIGYGFTLHEILDGKPKSATSEVWEGIRGGSAEIGFAFQDGNKSTSFQVDGKLPGESCSPFEFALAFVAEEGDSGAERLSVSGNTIYQACAERMRGPLPRVIYHPGTGGHLAADQDCPVLVQVARSFRDSDAKQVAHVLADMQCVDPSPALLREYARAYEIKRMGESGENFAALIRMICSDPGAKEAYLSWLRELRPREVDDVGVLKGALGEPMLMMKEGDREWPAAVLSDGTLRFAAIAAAFFQPDMPGIITIEEIENGIHASRLRLLVELLRSRTAGGKTQVIVTTHSPLVLAWLKPEEYATTFYCKRDEETGESHIVPLNEIPRFNEIVSKQPISDLFAEGWMEAAL